MRLKELRKEKSLTQEEIGKIINVNKMTYNGYENENREPSIETLCKLADFYNVTLDYLIGRERVNDIGYLTTEQISAVKVIKKLNHQNLLLLTGRALAMLESQGE